MAVKQDIAARRAFTLIDLVIAMLIMGIIAAAATPSYVHAIASFRVRAGAKRIEADFKFAQRHARRNSTTQRVVFDVASDSYTLDGLADLDHHDRGYAVNFSQTSYPVDVVTADFGGTTIVTFDHYGRPDNAGTVVVKNVNHTRTINVDANGIVSVSP